MHFLFLGIGELSFWLQAWRGIMMLLCKLIYKLIAGLFQLFITVSRLNILSSDEIAPIYQRVTMILTIVMVFYVTFEFVKYVIQPDTFSDKEKGAGKLVYRMILVVVLIAFVPKIFSLGYQFQNRIIENQVLSKVILGKKSMDFKTYGYDFSANVLSLFYNVDEEVCGSKCSEAESLVNTNLERLRKSGDTKYLDDSLNEANKVTIDGETRQRPIINFDGLFAVVVGGFIVYILILYSIDVGTRYAQLIFLQIMSPVAIISYISPKKDGMFSKWTKQCITTYIDLFIRLAIIYFVLLIVQVLGTAYDNGNLFEGLGEISGFMKVLCYIVLVMGLLVFANKAPKMLSELLPSSGAAGIGFGLKGADRVAPMAARAIGASAGGLVGMVDKTASRAINEHRRRKKIRDERTENGLPTDRASMRQALREVRQAARNARQKFNRQRQRLEEMSNKLNNQEITREEFDEFKRNHYDKAKAELNEARSKYAKLQNDSYGALIGLQGLSAALSGLTIGVKTGFGATKVEDIGKKISETAKNIKTDELSRMQFLQEGGNATISGSVQKTITKLQQTVGIKTASEIIKDEIKTIEAHVKANDSLASMEKGVKSAQDSSEDRSGKKIESKEQKIRVINDEDVRKLNDDIGNDKNGLGITIGKGQTTSEIYSMYEAKANTLRSNADAASKEAVRMRMNKDVEGISDETIQKAQDYADSLSAQAVAAENAKEQALKHLKRYGITRTLRGDIKTENGEKIDAVLAANIDTMRQAIENARSNPSTIEYLRGKLTPEQFAAFENNNILDFDTYDAIQGILTSHTVELANINSGLNETVRAINASSATDAANATANATGGKK